MLVVVPEVQDVGLVPSCTSVEPKAAQLELSCEPSNCTVAAVKPVTDHVSRQPAQPAEAPAVVLMAAPAVALVKVRA